MKPVHASITHVGRVRRRNEDSHGVVTFPIDGADEWYFVVADGMGGESAGDVASAMVVETFSERARQLRCEGRRFVEACEQSILEAHRAIASAAASTPERAGMGTTVAVLGVRGDSVVGAHVGDSRIYGVVGGEFRQLTRDHTVVQRLIDRGILTPEQAAGHPDGSVITRALGKEEPEVDLGEGWPRGLSGNTYLVCSDGVHGPVSDEAIEAAMRSLEVEDAVACLCELALERGAPDNLTAIVVRGERLAAPRSREWFMARFAPRAAAETTTGAYRPPGARGAPVGASASDEPTGRAVRGGMDWRSAAALVFVGAIVGALAMWVIASARRDEEPLPPEAAERQLGPEAAPQPGDAAEAGAAFGRRRTATEVAEELRREREAAAAAVGGADSGDAPPSTRDADRGVIDDTALGGGSGESVDQRDPEGSPGGARLPPVDTSHGPRPRPSLRQQQESGGSGRPVAIPPQLLERGASAPEAATDRPRPAAGNSPGETVDANRTVPAGAPLLRQHAPADTQPEVDAEVMSAPLSPPTQAKPDGGAPVPPDSDLPPRDAAATAPSPGPFTQQESTGDDAP